MTRALQTQVMAAMRMTRHDECKASQLTSAYEDIAHGTGDYVSITPINDHDGGDAAVHFDVSGSGGYYRDGEDDHYYDDEAFDRGDDGGDQYYYDDAYEYDDW